MKLKKNLLLWNYWANLNQTLLKWSLGVPLSKLCPSAPSCIKDGRHDKKIEISLNGQNCSILSQKVPKFELYKHNDEIFNIYYEIFLWTLNVCRFWPIMQIRKKGGWNLKKNLLLWNYCANLNQTLLKWFLGGPLPKLCPAFQNTDQDGATAELNLT